jgi:hypothetical protein
MVVTSAPKKLLSDSENTLFQVVKTLEIASRLYWCQKKRFLSDSEIWLLQGAKTLEIASKLIWRSDKAISFEFGKFTFYVRQNTRNRVKVVLSP